MHTTCVQVRCNTSGVTPLKDKRSVVAYAPIYIVMIQWLTAQRQQRWRSWRLRPAIMLLACSALARAPRTVAKTTVISTAA